MPMLPKWQVTPEAQMSDVAACPLLPSDLSLGVIPVRVLLGRLEPRGRALTYSWPERLQPTSRQR